MTKTYGVNDADMAKLSAGLFDDLDLIRGGSNTIDYNIETPADIAAAASEREYHATVLHYQSIMWLMPALLAHMNNDSEDYICSKAHVLSMLDMDEDMIMGHFSGSSDLHNAATDIAKSLCLYEMSLSELTKPQRALACKMYAMYETSSPELPGGMSVGSKGYKIASRVFTSHLPTSMSLSNEIEP